MVANLGNLKDIKILDSVRLFVTISLFSKCLFYSSLYLIF